MEEGAEPLNVIVLIGHDVSSAGSIVRALPPHPGAAVVVAVDGENLAPTLETVSPLPVVDVSSTIRLQRDHVYAVTSRMQPLVQPDALVIDKVDGPGHFDRLLRSLADNVGRAATVVVVGGSNGDGTLGLKRVREAGGLAICQRVDDGPFSELPRSVVNAGVVDLVLPIDQIAGRMVRPLRVEKTFGEGTRSDETLRDILALIRIRTGHDFAGYKRATLYRRLARRMHVCDTETIVEYHRLVREHPTELTHLLRDFLISVTNFFRDPDSFQALAETALPRIFKGKHGADQVRVWVAGCATGEEAYSLAILLCEHASLLADPPQLQVFATDIDDDALQEARAGVYPEQIATDVSKERLDRYFTREPEGYRVAKGLRDMMLFSPHNLLRDPPFSRLDLVSCRNLLIYLNRDAQDRVLNTFHFALRADGLLFLGSSESAENTQQFAAIDPKNRMFERRLAATGITTDALLTATRWLPSRAPFPLPTSERPPIGSFGELHHRSVELYGPPSVLVNEELDVVHLSEHASRFLTIAGGEPTRQILRMVHPALRFELRGALYAAREPANKGTDTRIVRFDDAGVLRSVELRVRAVELQEAGAGTMLVMFDELEAPRELLAAATGTSIEPVVRDLEDELRRTRDQLRTTIEQYETSLEELKASNEELHAINEELRSATEELETSKEELQSVNEELTTLNLELKVKVDELSHANSDLQNLMTSTEIGVLFLDRELAVKRFTPRVQDLFNVIPGDVGRPFAHLTHRLDYSDLPQAAAQVLRDLRTTDREVATTSGRRYLLRIVPYRSLEDRIDGVVMTFVDVTDLKVAEAARVQSEATLRVTEERLALALAAAPIAVISHDASLAATWAFVEGKEVDPNDVGRVFAGQDAERYTRIVREVYSATGAQRVELEVATQHGNRTFDFRIEPRRSGQLVSGVTAIGFDITPSKLAERALRKNDRMKDEFIAMLSHELRNPLTPLRVAFDVARLAKGDTGKLETAFGVMDQQIEVLVRLVDDLLDVSRIAQGKIQLVLAPVDTTRVVEAALAATRSLFDKHRHSVHVDLPKERLVVIGDFTRLAQVLTNLLTNAAKYTPDGGEIRVSLAADDHQKLHITVQDNGVGIGADTLPRVFDMFAQAKEAEHRRQGGLGIGLNLVRKIVELHDGTVTAHSDGLDKGSSFTVQLPLAKST